MATFAAIRSLASAIKTDVLDGVSAVQTKVAAAQAERRIVGEFKAALREHPVELTTALSKLARKTKK